MANSSEFNGHGLAMRNGHAKSTRPIEGRRGLGTPAVKDPEEKRPSAKKVVASGGALDVRPRGVRVERRFDRAGIDPLDAVVYERARAPSPIPTAASSSRWRAPRCRRAGASSRPTSSSPSTSARPGLHGDKDAGETSVRQVVHRLAHTIRVARATQFGGYFATKSRRRRVRGRALAPARATSTARSTRRCGSTSASGTSTGSRARAATGLGTPTARTSPRRRTPTSARSARRASSRRSRTT